MRRVLPIFPASCEHQRAKIVCCGFEASEYIHAVVRHQSADLVVLADVAELASCLDESDWGCIIAGDCAAKEQVTQTLAQFCKDRPGLSWIVWSSNLDLPAAVGAMQGGALNVIRSEDTAALATSIEAAIRQGYERLIAWRQVSSVRRRLGELSVSERQVLALVMKGWTNREIAVQLDFSLRTVESRRQRLLRVMQAENAVTLAAMLARHDLLDEIVDAVADNDSKESRSASA